jgi:hypothetical protein
MGDGSGVNTLYCNACRLRFALYARRTRKTKRKVFCPWCGDNADVTAYDKREIDVKYTRRYWKVLEVAELTRLLEQGKRPIELTAQFNRSSVAIGKKAKRLGFKFDSDM